MSIWSALGRTTAINEALGFGYRIRNSWVRQLSDLEGLTEALEEAGHETLPLYLISRGRTGVIFLDSPTSSGRLLDAYDQTRDLLIEIGRKHGDVIVSLDASLGHFRGALGRFLPQLQQFKNAWTCSDIRPALRVLMNSIGTVPGPEALWGGLGLLAYSDCLKEQSLDITGMTMALEEIKSSIVRRNLWVAGSLVAGALLIFGIRQTTKK